MILVILLLRALYVIVRTCQHAVNVPFDYARRLLTNAELDMIARYESSELFQIQNMPECSIKLLGVN